MNSSWSNPLWENEDQPSENPAKNNYNPIMNCTHKIYALLNIQNTNQCEATYTIKHIFIEYRSFAVIRKRLIIWKISLKMSTYMNFGPFCETGALGNVEYPFIAIAPRSLLARSGSTYGLNWTNSILMLNWIVWVNWIAWNRNDFDN